MRILPHFTRQLRDFRIRAIDRLLKGPGFRKFVLYLIGSDTVWMTRKFPDHMMTFCPHEFVGKQIYRRGNYQRGLADRVLQLLKSLPDTHPRTIVEIGANIGTHSVYLMIGGQFNHIVCVEPDPRNVALLKRNLDINDLRAKSTIFECAAGSTNGNVELFLNDGNHGASSFNKSVRTARSTNVPLRRVDDILASAGVQNDQVGLIWMDIEGAEPEALKSMAPLLDLRVPLVMEFSPRFYGVEKTKELVETLASKYDNCVVFPDGEEEIWLPVREIPTDQQIDVFLLPPSITARPQP